MVGILFSAKILEGAKVGGICGICNRWGKFVDGVGWVDGLMVEWLNG